MNSINQNNRHTFVKNFQQHDEQHHTDAEHIIVEQSPNLQGECKLVGAKNAVLVIIASLILTEGKSILKNVPKSDDVLQMIALLEDLGAHIFFDYAANILFVDTSTIQNNKVRPEIMKKMRASILVMGPLLARFGKANIALPGGCLLGKRPIDFHLKNFIKMGTTVEQDGEFITASTPGLKATKIVLEYPSVGATENLLMAATTTKGTTQIVNAALEPEVLDLIEALKKMGARINITAPANIFIEGVEKLNPIEHTIINDRLEVGTLLLATAITGGTITLPDANANHLETFLLMLEEMGHIIKTGPGDIGITLSATKSPKAVSFRTSPYPGFPTDLQAPMMATLCLAEGKSVIHETVFENRFLHIRELQKMGAQITLDGDRATVSGVEELFGTSVIATDIRASCALVIAGLAAKGTTIMTGVNHWTRGYENLEKKLATLGARIKLKTTDQIS